MPGTIDISLDFVNVNPVSVELTYSGSSVAVEITEPDAPVIEISFANIGPKGEDASMLWGDLTGDIDDQTDLKNSLKKIKVLALAGL